MVEIAGCPDEFEDGAPQVRSIRLQAWQGKMNQMVQNTNGQSHVSAVSVWQYLCHKRDNGVQYVNNLGVCFPVVALPQIAVQDYESQF